MRSAFCNTLPTPTEEKVLANANYDGKVDTTDARIILQKESETYPSEL